MSRRAALKAAFPELMHPLGQGDGRRRANAHSAISRALASLERKGMLVRHRSPATGVSMLADPARERRPGA